MILSSIGTDSNSKPADGTASAQAAGNLQNDLNRFLNLLVTQLKNQDPLDPLNSNEFTSQLVQFASVEQQIYQNSNLEKILGIQQTNQVSSMVNFIDKEVEVDGQDFNLENSQAKMTYTMPAGAKSANLIIRDQSGRTVYEADADTTAGKHTFEWDGRDRNGNTSPDGAYQVIVTGQDYQGQLLDVTHTVFGRVTGVAVQDGQTSLYMGDVEIPYTSVLSVSEAPTTTTTN